MAILFDDASEEHVSNANAVVLGVPLVLAGWFKFDDMAADQAIISIGDTDGSNWFELLLRGSAVGDPLWAWPRQSGSGDVAATSTGASANTWHHGCALFAATNDYRVLIDNGSKGTQSTNRTPQTLDNTTIGAMRVLSNVIHECSGAIAEAAVWDLTNWPGATNADKADAFEDIALPGLAAGASPLFWPLGLTPWSLKNLSDLKDPLTGYDMTASGGTTAEHPLITYPTGPVYVHAAAAVGNPWYYRAQQEAVA